MARRMWEKRAAGAAPRNNMKQLPIAIISGFLFASSAHAICVPAREEILLPKAGGGQYHRFHPSGNYVIRTRKEEIELLDLTDRANPKIHETRLQEETYPVEAADGGWELLASPYDNGGMNYYHFKEILADKMGAKAVYVDKRHDEYYHSSAELPGSTKDVKKIRTLLYGRSVRDYVMKRDSSGRFTDVTPGPRFERICTSFVGDPTPALDRTLNPEDLKKALELEAEVDRMDAEIKSKGEDWHRSKEGFEFVSKKNRIKDAAAEYKYGSHYLQLNAKLQELLKLDPQPTAEIQKLNKEAYDIKNDGEEKFANPILSKDGQFVAATDKKSVQIYRILEGGRCEQVGSTGYPGSKVSFSYPEPGKLPKITFTTESGPSGKNATGVHIYDLNTKATQYVGKVGFYNRYPGFLKDGRVAYTMRDESNNDYKHYIVILDPNQAEGTNPRTCIQKATRSGNIRPAAAQDSNSGNSAE